MTTLPNQRHLFEIPDGVAYLNMATMGPLPLAAQEAGSHGLARKLQPWNIAEEDFFHDTRRLRPLIARLINADAAGIAIIPAASYGLATAARNLPLAAGQDILVLEDQFPSNVYVWRTLAERTGANLVTVGTRGNEPLSDALLAAIGPNTGLVATGQVRWTDGARMDLAAISRKCRQVGAHLVLDLSQSCGAMRFDVAEIDPDFVVSVGYKWLFGPYGVGFLYAAPRHRGGVPLEENWITRKGSSNFARLIDYQDEYADGAERYDMGERSNFALLPALAASLDMLLGWGIDRVEATLAGNNRRLADRLAAIGLSTPPEADRGPHYIGAHLPASTPDDLTHRLKAEHIHVSRRGDRLRITPHLFNTEEDFQRLLDALARHLRP